MRKAIFALVLGICTLPSLAPCGWANGVRPARLVLDADTGKILVADQANAAWYPASLTKLMTAYLVFGEIASGRLGMDTQITVSAKAAAQPPTKVGFRVGQKLSVGQAVTAMIVASANDAAVALAERIGGSESGFVQRMNATAQRLGMAQTRFMNANGLPDDNQVTTARDIAVLALAIIREYPDRYPLFGLRAATVAGRTLPTVDSILGAYPGADGMKTGFTCGSGYNMVGSARHGDRRLVAVVLGASDRAERMVLIRKLFDSGFSGEASVPPIMSDIALTPASMDSGAPPTVLKASECDASVSTDGDAGGGGKLSGWGIIFGAYASPDQAHQAIGGMQLRLKGLINGGRPTVVQRQFEGARHYEALLVGLSPNDAGRACKQLWGQRLYCLALNPIVLNDPNAMWR